MILTSEYTGHGHKSITEALTEQFSRHSEVKLNIIDGYDLSGSIGLKIGKLYGTITRASKDIWKLIWDISIKHPYVIIDLIENSIQESFVKVLNTIEPDIIITTHPNYFSSILNILEHNNRSIPLYAIVADPVSITPLWSDARAHFTICPTEEAKAACMRFGVPESKIKVFGFPVRERFVKIIDSPDVLPLDQEKPLRCLIMSGGEGSGNMSRIAKNILNNFNSSVKIICGRNKTLKKRMELTMLDKYKGRIEIFGFVTDIENIMAESDILFTRASPNAMMEAVMCNLPLVITGALPGQEEGNPAYIEKYNLGVVCTEPRRIKETVQNLLKNDAEELNKIKKSQYDYRDPDIVKNIVNFILSDSYVSFSGAYPCNRL